MQGAQRSTSWVAALHIVTAIIATLLVLYALLNARRAREEFDIALSDKGRNIILDVTSTTCKYEDASDTTGVLSVPPVTSLDYVAEQQHLQLTGDLKDNQTRCYVQHKSYYNEPDLPCSMANNKIFDTKFSTLISSIAVADYGDDVQKVCAVTFNPGQKQEFLKYVDYIDKKNPIKEDITNRIQTDTDVAINIKTVRLPEAKKQANDADIDLRNVKKTIAELLSELISNSTTLGKLDEVEATREKDADKVEEMIKDARLRLQEAIDAANAAKERLRKKQEAERERLSRIEAERLEALRIELEIRENVLKNMKLGYIAHHKFGPMKMDIVNGRMVIRLKSGTPINFTSFTDSTVYGRNLGWNRWGLLANNDPSTALRHTDMVMYLNPFGPGNYDFSWWFHPMGDGKGFHLYNDYPGNNENGSFVGYDEKADVVKIFKRKNAPPEYNICEWFAWIDTGCLMPGMIRCQTKQRGMGAPVDTIFDGRGFQKASDCAAKCLGNPNCRSMFYDNGYCYLFKKDYGDGVWFNRDTRTTVWKAASDSEAATVASIPQRSTLRMNDFLAPGHYLSTTANVTMNNKNTSIPLKLLYQDDGNLVLYAYRPSDMKLFPFWNTETFRPPRIAQMQQNGNFSVYDVPGNKVWAVVKSEGKKEEEDLAMLYARAGSTSRLNSYITLEPNGNLVLYSSTNKVIWNSNSAGNFQALIPQLTQ